MPPDNMRIHTINFFQGVRNVPAGAAKYAMAKVYDAYGATSSKIGRMRSERRAGREVLNVFTEEERERMN